MKANHYPDDDLAGATEGLGPGSAGQSGDLQGLLTDEDSNSESVTELLEEGQAYEASIVSGIENAPNADASEVRTRQVREDDVPEEYLDMDEPAQEGRGSGL